MSKEQEEVKPMNKALKLAQHIMSKLKTSDEETEYKEQEVKHTPQLAIYVGREECIITDEHANSMCTLLHSYYADKKECVKQANFIVTACNSHYALKKENEELRATVGEMGQTLKEAKEYFDNEATSLWGLGECALSLNNKATADHIKSILNKAGITV